MDLDESLDAESEWVPFKQQQPMEESLVAVSEKVSFQNASSLNRAELQRARKLMKTQEEPLEDTQNEFLEVGKWRKNKQSALSQEMASVKNEVQQGMTNIKWNASQKQLKWSERTKEKEKEEVIADESICPDQEHREEEEAIEDQTQGEEEEEGEQEEEEQEEQEQQEEEEEEQQEEQQEEEQQQQEEESGSQEEEQKKQPLKDHESDDDKTDTQSQMKRTEYLPSKWTKKSQTNSSLSDWQRKEAILKRILILVK